MLAAEAARAECLAASSAVEAALAECSAVSSVVVEALAEYSAVSSVVVEALAGSWVASWAVAACERVRLSMAAWPVFSGVQLALARSIATTTMSIIAQMLCR